MRLRLNKDLKTVYIFATLCSLVLIAGFGVCEIYDSFSYIDAWDSLSEGRLDALRTPVYPLFLHGLSVVFGLRHYLFAAICFQHLFFLGSLYFFYRLLERFCSSRTLVFYLALIYGVLPAITSWNNCILTESLALSGTVILLELVFRTMENPSAFRAVLIALLLTLLLLLRPIFIYIIPVFIVFFLALLLGRKGKKGAWCIGTGVLLSSLCFILYMHEFKKEYGIFASSNVSIINQYYMARQNNLIDTTAIRDARLRADIGEYFLQHGERVEDLSLVWEEAQEIVTRHRLDVIRESLETTARGNAFETLRSVKNRFVSSAQKPLWFSPIWRISVCFYSFGFFLNTLYLFLLVYSLILVCQIFKHRKLPWNTLLLYMLGISNIIVAVVGAQDEWGRLIFPSMPIWFILVGQLCGFFKRNGQDDTLLS